MCLDFVERPCALIPTATLLFSIPIGAAAPTKGTILNMFSAKFSERHFMHCR